MLASALLGLHFVFLAYVVAGGFLTWRWPRAIVPHVAAAAWGLLVAAQLVNCPLTAAEDWARRRGGESALALGFIDRYIEGVMYPERFTPLLRVLVAFVIAASWLVAALRWRRRQIDRSDTARKGAESSRPAVTV
ncbi:MAG TPA: DUF2784 domain-containing protein [Micromonosporaceae bacterium]|nr:DUF2784 domain-containing protein [Micromonosporaceae bacterium]